MTEILNPCPFCGKAVKLSSQTGKFESAWIEIECIDCKVTMKAGYEYWGGHPNREESTSAITARWNQRSEVAQKVA